MNIGSRIRRTRESRNKTLLEVAKALDVTEATVQRYESGNIKNLKLDTITKLSNVLNVDPAYLMGWKQLDEDLTTEYEYSYLPVSISAGLPLSVEAITADDVEKISIPNSIMGKWAGDDNVFITRTNGDSMNKVFPHGSLLGVKKVPLDNLNNGDIVVFSENGEYSVKRYYKYDDKIVFRPDSNSLEFTDYVVSSDNVNLLIHGKVVVYIVELD